MPGLGLTVDVVTDEVIKMLARAQMELSPYKMGARMRDTLRSRFQDQAREAFSRQAPAGSANAWEPLSEWRVRDRGSDSPIMSFTNQLQNEVVGFRGRLRIIQNETGFSFWFPDVVEMSPKYWGLTAGQHVNPLGATPLAARPRRIFGDTMRQQNDAVDALKDYFQRSGFLVEVT